MIFSESCRAFEKIFTYFSMGGEAKANVPWASNCLSLSTRLAVVLDKKTDKKGDFMIFFRQNWMCLVFKVPKIRS
jgi:hypothetical protein